MRVQRGTRKIERAMAKRVSGYVFKALSIDQALSPAHMGTSTVWLAAGEKTDGSLVIRWGPDAVHRRYVYVVCVCVMRMGGCSFLQISR